MVLSVVSSDVLPSRTRSRKDAASKDVRLSDLKQPESVAKDAYPGVDEAGFRRAMDELRNETEASLSIADYHHWQKMRRWGQASTAVGYATAWIAPNPFSAAAIALGNTAKWAVVAHHASHKCLDRIPGVPHHHTSKGFAKGSRRYLDWFDWIYPEAWNLEHNVLHHFYTGELSDPDLVEENTAGFRNSKGPVLLKYLGVAFYALTWKYTYYAPNTMQVLWRSRKHRERASVSGAGSEPSILHEPLASNGPTFDPRTELGRAFWTKCLLPYGLARFVAAPAAFAPLGPWAVFSVWSNSVMAECIANVHSFLIIGPNHAGDDLYRFDGASKAGDPRAQQVRNAGFYIRQVLGSVNYSTGGDLRDFLHGFLNYQIEHHLFPTLPPSAYQRIQPKVKAICERYGVPYVQEPLHKRVRQLVRIMVGKASMLRQ
jgi:Fatty acid desaturase